MVVFEYFKDVTQGGSDRLLCACGCGLKPDDEAMEALYAVRLIYGRWIKILSGARCAAHNASIEGTSNSQHIKGIAFDLSSANNGEVRRIAELVGFRGIGIGKTKLHIDKRISKVTVQWVYT